MISKHSMRKAAISFLLAVLASVLGLALPMYHAQTSLQRSGEASTVELRHETLSGVNGPTVRFLLAIPVIIAGVPILLRFRAVRIISAVLLVGWVVIGAASVGLFYLPSAITMILAASKNPA
jgi:hypothetical protein